DDFIVKDLSHLFADIPLSLILKNNQYLHGYALHFIEQISHRFNAPLLQKLLYQPITEDYSI
ncbi:MAG: HTH-type transcriptional regulator CysB, partial [Neisseriaceae bacterium]|nr:HTH-type transcriptional regulator CysB [Neisseriaceae bacterium]